MPAREVFSVTLADIREHGRRSLLVYCGALDCNHCARLNADHPPDATRNRTYWSKTTLSDIPPLSNCRAHLYAQGS